LTGPDVEGRSPGWYDDPDDTDAIRYWNGSAWTGQRRPRPEWTDTTPALSPPPSYLQTRRPGAPGPNMWWVALALIAVAASLAWALSLTILKRHNVGPRTITDASFIAAANSLCRQQLTPLLNAQRPKVGDSDALVADKTEAAATGLDALIATLRQIPVQRADQARVGVWLDNWARYVQTGHAVAVADRTHDASKYEPLLEQGRKQRFPVTDFAQANGIKRCTF
jgi:Protein of unknown function (DUF2510)